MTRPQSSIFETLLSAPAVAPVSHRELEKLICSQMDTVPLDTLRQVAHSQQIDAHNTEINRKKSERKKLRQVAKQARVPVDVLKRAIAGAKK